MKKLIITIGILTSVAVGSSYGQGTIVFGNSGGSRISTNSGPGGVTGVGLVAASGTQTFYYALFYSTTLTSVNGSTAGVIGAGTYAFNVGGWNDSTTGGAYSTNTTAGRLQPSAPNTDGSASMANLGGGVSADMVVIGWSANIGSTVASLQAWLANPTVNGWIGESAVGGPLAPGILGSTSPTTLFGASPNIPGFVLGEVLATTPEPGTLALCALGGASMLLFRRKK